MTATNPRPRTFHRSACAAGLAVLLALTGCKSKDGGGGIFGGGSSPEKSRDPLVFGPSRIPPQNVPVPDRGGVGSKGKSDPLTTPASKNGDKTGVGYSTDPERFKGTYIPGVGSTPASLASKLNDGNELKIDTPDNRVPLRPGGEVKPAGNFEAAGDGVEALYAELEKYGVKPANRRLTQEDGQYVFRASVPISGNGAVRGYEERGATANEAVKRLLDQVVADRK